VSLGASYQLKPDWSCINRSQTTDLHTSLPNLPLQDQGAGASAGTGGRPASGGPPGGRPPSGVRLGPSP